ncbi:MAG TPA: hypothetical protein GYA10_06505, partial [Alphaproteobacteria bacterium]|nr:hypothetical protein [Alphaproteobacteria bacterium]
MPWLTRSLPDISQRLRGAWREWLPGTDTGLANNVVTVITKVQAALAHEFELRMAWLTRQMFIATATGAWLEQHCGDIGIYRKPRAAASGEVFGSGSPNTTYSAGIRFIAGGQTYRSTTSVTTNDIGFVSIPVVAEAKGAVTNREPGAMLSLADPALWPGLDAQWEVDGDGLGGGADREDDESLRARGLQRKQNPPRGGALTDYERIARSVPGVLNAWAFRRPDAPGFLAVLFLFTGRENMIPLAADVEAVQAAIDAERLIRVDDSVAVAPVPLAIDVEIGGLQNDTEEVRAGVAAAIQAMYLAKCRPGITGDTFTVSRSWISEAISGVTGETRHRLIAPA